MKSSNSLQVIHIEKYFNLTVIVLFYIITLISTAHAQTFAPLAVGNIWVYQEYESSPQRVKYYVSGTTTIDNNLYFICRKSENDSIVNYFRVDDSGLYISRYGSQEIPYYKINAAIADTFIAQMWFGKIKYTVTNISEENIFGNSVMVKNLNVYWIFGNFSETWSEEFGLLSRSNYLGETRYILKGCVIDGTVYGDTSLVITGVKNEIKELNTKIYLDQNYPNPFNPSTVISYRISEFSHVTLKIYNMVGREVATLVDEYKHPGSYQATFTTQQTTNQVHLSSGVYFYKLVAGIFSETKKMIVLK